MNNLVYVLLILFIGILLFVNSLFPSKKFRILIAAILIVFSGFRYNVGTDYVGYSHMFRLINEIGRYYNIEWGFFYLVKFLGKIGGTEQLMFFMITAITIVFIYNYIEHFSEDINLSWIIFICIGPYFLSSFNGIRQMLSVAIFAYSLKYVENKEFWKYSALNVVSGLFHYSAFILIPFYFILIYKKFNMKKAILLYGIYIVLEKIGIINYILSFFHASSYAQGSDKFQMGSSYYIFIILALLCWFYFLFINNKDDDILFKNLNLLSFLTVVTAFISQDISNMVFTRFNQYFFIGYIVFLPHILNTIRDVRIRSLFRGYLIIFSITYYILLTSSATDLTPYQMNFNLFV